MNKKAKNCEEKLCGKKKRLWQGICHSQVASIEELRKLRKSKVQKRKSGKKNQFFSGQNFIPLQRLSKFQKKIPTCFKWSLVSFEILWPLRRDEISPSWDLLKHFSLSQYLVFTKVQKSVLRMHLINFQIILTCFIWSLHCDKINQIDMIN